MNIGSSLPFNWFDLVFVCVLIAGVFRGRKNGMSGELLPLLQWVLIVFGCAALYEPVGNALASAAQFGRLFSYVAAYVTIAIAIKVVFSGIRYVLKGKLLGSDFFGKGEYYLGMIAGMVRAGCMVFVLLALLNARLFTEAEIRQDREFQKDVYGSQFFPKLYTVQQHVFERSASGVFIKQHLSSLLIKPTPPEKVTIQRREWQPPW